jgi:hypothetical protein
MAGAIYFVFTALETMNIWTQEKGPENFPSAIYFLI